MTVDLTDEELGKAINTVRDSAWPLNESMQNGQTGKKIVQLAEASMFRRTRDKELSKESGELFVPSAVVIAKGDDLVLPNKSAWERLAKTIAKIEKRASEIFTQRDVRFK